MKALRSDQQATASRGSLQRTETTANRAKTKPMLLVAMSADVLPLALPEQLMTRLRSFARVEVLDNGFLEDPATRSLLAETEVMLTGWGCPGIDEAVLDAAPRLRGVLHAAGSVKGLLPYSAWTRGIAVSSAAQINAVPVARYALSMIYLASKGTFKLAAEYRRGIHRDMTTHPGYGAVGRTVGIIGASQIGRLVMARLADGDSKILVYDPTITDQEAAGLGAELVGLADLMKRSDIVSVHAPLLAATRHLLNDTTLGLLRKGATVINTARGGIIDTEALYRRCATGHIDAVLDVTEPEPLPPGHPLLSLDNVLITTHVAGAMGSEVSRLGGFAVSEAERLLDGLPLKGAVAESQLGLLA